MYRTYRHVSHWQGQTPKSFSVQFHEQMLRAGPSAIQTLALVYTLVYNTYMNAKFVAICTIRTICTLSPYTNVHNNVHIFYNIRVQ